MTRAEEKPRPKARAVGINHIALEVGDIDAALDFYGAFLDFEIARRSDTAAFVYFGDQFIILREGAPPGPGRTAPLRHRRGRQGVGAGALGGTRRDLPGRALHGLPRPRGGNRVEITTYTNIQFTKADHVLRGMGLGHLQKTDEALGELRRKGMAPETGA